MTTKTLNAAKKTAGILGAVAAGAAVGYATGVLSAPASGADTRRRIQRRVEDGAMNAKSAVRRKAREAGDAVANLANRAHRSSV
jgi:gas vesicle protein